MAIDNTTNTFLGGFFNEDEDEYIVKKAPKANALDMDSVAVTKTVVTVETSASGTILVPKSDYAEIDILIESNMRALRQKYPEGGIKSSRVITSKILREAPTEYFDRFEKDLEDGTVFVQNLLVDRGGSELIAMSQIGRAHV